MPGDAASAVTSPAASGGANLPALPIPLQANVMSARTTLDGPGGQASQQTAGATGEVASLSIGVPSGSAPIPTNGCRVSRSP